MKANKMIIGLACLLACSVSVLALDDEQDVPGIQGTFTAEDGSLLRSIRVVLYDSMHGKVGSTLAAADGSFRFSGLRCGVYYLECVRPGVASAWYGGATREPIVVGTTMVTVEIVALE